MCDTPAITGAACLLSDRIALHINYAKRNLKLKLTASTVQMSYLGQSTCRILIII